MKLYMVPLTARSPAVLCYLSYLDRGRVKRHNPNVNEFAELLNWEGVEISRGGYSSN